MTVQNNKPDTKHEALQALKFTLFSISAGIIQIGTYTLFYEVFHWAPWLAYLVSLILSVLWNFTFNRKFTFRSAANVPKAMLKVAAYYAVFTPATIGLEYLLADRNGWNEYLVLAINMLLNLVTEFLYQKYVVFAKHIDDNMK